MKLSRFSVDRGSSLDVIIVHKQNARIIKGNTTGHVSNAINFVPPSSRLLARIRFSRAHALSYVPIKYMGRG
jgi:hypothetical protein